MDSTGSETFALVEPAAVWPRQPPINARGLAVGVLVAATAVTALLVYTTVRIVEDPARIDEIVLLPAGGLMVYAFLVLAAPQFAALRTKPVQLRLLPDGFELRYERGPGERFRWSELRGKATAMAWTNTPAGTGELHWALSIQDLSFADALRGRGWDRRRFLWLGLPRPAHDRILAAWASAGVPVDRRRYSDSWGAGGTIETHRLAPASGLPGGGVPRA